jgi:hypothetical protein
MLIFVKQTDYIYFHPIISIILSTIGFSTYLITIKKDVRDT